VATELVSNGRRASISGYLNSWGLPLGSIVRINPGSTRSEAIVEWQRLPLSASDLLISSTALQSITISDGFEVHLDDDLRTIGRGMGIDLDSTIVKHSVLYVDGSVTRGLPDVAAPLNRYPDIVARIRSAPAIRLAIVSGTVDGSDLNIFDTYPSAAANTVELGNSYVHVSYACRVIANLGHQARRAIDGVPLVIYLTPIKYDNSTARVAPDSLPLDLLHRK